MLDPLTALSAAAASVTAIKEIGTAAFGAHNAQVANAAKLEFMEKLFDAQTKLGQVAAAIIEKDAVIASQGERIRELEHHKSERARYELQELAPGRHLFAYRLKPVAALTERTDEPTHFLCQPCFDSSASRKAVLIRSDSDTFGPSWVCPVCRVDIAT